MDGPGEWEEVLTLSTLFPTSISIPQSATVEYMSILFEPHFPSRPGERSQRRHISTLHPDRAEQHPPGAASAGKASRGLSESFERH